MTGDDHVATSGKEKKHVRTRWPHSGVLLYVRVTRQFTYKMRFRTCYVHATNCLTDTKYEQNPNETMLNKALRVKGTPKDTL